MEIYEEIQKQIQEFCEEVIINKTVSDISTVINEYQKCIEGYFDNIMKQIKLLQGNIHQNDKKLEAFDDSIQGIRSSIDPIQSNIINYFEAKNQEIKTQIEMLKNEQKNSVESEKTNRRMNLFNLILNIIILVSIVTILLFK